MPHVCLQSQANASSPACAHSCCESSFQTVINVHILQYYGFFQGQGEGGCSLATGLVGALTIARSSAQVCMTCKWVCRRCALTTYYNVNRPLAWSKSSVIFSAHHTKPLVLARHFNSSRHFELAVPQAIRLDPDSYSPPTLIYISPDDDWLFAYFSGAKDNIGCLWHRGLHLDAWTIGDSWSMAHGAGIVAAAWVTSHREVSSPSSHLCTNLELMVHSLSGLSATQARHRDCHLLARHCLSTVLFYC